MHKTSYELRIRDWSSDVCSSDLHNRPEHSALQQSRQRHPFVDAHRFGAPRRVDPDRLERLDRARNALQAMAEHIAALAEAFFGDRKSDVEERSVLVRVDLGGRRLTKKKN